MSVCSAWQGTPTGYSQLFAHYSQVDLQRLMRPV